MKTLDEVIEALNNCADVNANYEACECCKYRDIRDDGYDCGRLQMMEDALHYLQEYQEILPLVPSLIITAIEVQKKGKTIG